MESDHKISAAKNTVFLVKLVPCTRGQRNVVRNKMWWVQCPIHCQFHSQNHVFFLTTTTLLSLSLMHSSGDAHTLAATLIIYTRRRVLQLDTHLTYYSMTSTTAYFKLQDSSSRVDNEGGGQSMSVT